MIHLFGKDLLVVNRSIFIGLPVVVEIASLLMLPINMCSQEEPKKMISVIKDTSDIINLFPKNPQTIEERVKDSIAGAQQQIDSIIAIPDNERTFVNTAKALDILESQSALAIMAPLAEVINFTDPDEQMRSAAKKGILEIDKFFTDKISNNPALYKVFKAYFDGAAKKEKLTDEENYYLQERMKAFKRNGLHLPVDQLEEVKVLKNKIRALRLQFAKNINEDATTITVTREELAGLSNDFIDVLKQTDDGLYIIGMDYPTYFTVIDFCDIASTRQKIYRAFHNLAYPANESLLKEIFKLRDELAKKLGFKSYAHLDLDAQMAKTPEKAQIFLKELLDKVQIKEATEFEQLKVDLPKSVRLSPGGKLYPWDVRYTIEQYKKKHFTIDENQIAEYFPMEKIIEGLLNIYQQFLGLRFKQIPISGLWHEDVSLIEARDRLTEELLGYLLLDLYPRSNKLSHACHYGIIRAVKGHYSNNPTLELIIANFTRSTPTKPSLLKRNELETFFHEFGHALHSMLGRTSLGSYAGINVKTDFAEVPSMMFEEWIRDKDILKMVSSHYKTGQPLPDDLIDKIIAAKKLSRGWWTQRQIFFSRMSLDYHKEGAEKDLNKIMCDLYDQIRVNQILDPEDHQYTNFGHLSGYGAKYYSYLWSLVFAIDLFAEIKKHDLLNQEIGKRLIAEVLGKGGSKDPYELLIAFLGREPNQDNFLQSVGLDIE